ncbi:MAG: tetratricopeptide repeat protein [Gammaproteobacteria bacterium]|nr:tetratricopeptide repeat protein [Gammaproteobacteria bacterium]MCP5200439.1 tetratricopeptide repeat protein [Gammaproteobacteria bacterium]
MRHFAHCPRALSTFLLGIALAACATPPPRPAAPAASSPAVAAPAPVAAPLVPFEYEDDPLYRLLVAEFAGQRGYLDVATEQYLELARSERDARLAERATRIAVFSRDDDAALAAAKVWVELAPEDMDARQILAAMYIRHGQAQPAMENLEYVLTHDDAVESGNRLRMIANLLGREDDRDTALEVMGELVDHFKDDTDALLAYALLAVRAERLDDARRAIRRVVERTELPSNVAMAYLAVLQKQDKLPEAIDWLDELLSLNPDQFGLRLIYARMLAEANRYEEARVQFGVLAEQSPDNTDITFALGLLNLQAGRNDDAAANFEQLLKLETREDEAHFYLGQIAEARGERQAAIEHYQAIEGGSNYFAAQLRKALVLALLGRVDEAVAFLDQVQPEDDQQRFDLARAKGEILVEHGRLDEAMAIYDAALAGGHYDTELLYTRAMLAEKMGRIDVLERDLRAIIEAEPDNAQALNALGYTLADRTERFEEAHALIERALELSPEDFYILDSMGWVLYRLGRLDDAIPYLERARELRNDPEVAAHLGEVLWVKGQREEAREVWETALKDTPNDKKLLDVIQRLTP